MVRRYPADRRGSVTDQRFDANLRDTSPVSTSPEELAEALEEARRWLVNDPDPATADELRSLLKMADAEPTSEEASKVVALFTGRIAFGTAGLRAALGPGPNRMNRLVVRQTTAGLMRWFKAKGVKQPVVVVGYDARYGSAPFAVDTVGVVATLGGRAKLLPRPLPTPVLAHSVLELGADAGIMITASHNPPADNGYKLYLSDGIQLVSPADAEIAAAIDVVSARELPPVDLEHAGIRRLGRSVAADHIQAAVGALKTTQRSVKTVYTAMHGVGGEHLMEAFAAAGFPAPIPVPEQFDPDPDFPTVPFPNPEEPGALDLALALAEEVSADLVIANDPDADRLALAVPARASDDPDAPRYQALTGDQIGVLLADHLLRNTEGPGRLVSNSIVSSQLLGRMAESQGVEHVETLTGFKWVARPIVDRPECTFVLGYEEALGYCVGDAVRDKDGISAALVAAELAADALAKGETLWDRLDRLAIDHGLHLTGPVTVRLPGVDGMARRTQLLNDLIANPPETLGGATLIDHLDLSVGRDLPPTPGFVMHFDDRSRVIVRPSGTEPKLKSYIEVVETVADPTEVDAARQRARARLEQFQTELDERFSG